MNRIFGAVALLLAVGPACAADLQRNVQYAPVAPAIGYSWSGAYLGLNLGHLWSSTETLGAAPRGLAGGIQGGYNLQLGPVVVGGEADLQGTAADDTFAAYKFSNPWFGTVRGRVGYAFSTVLLYATAGLAFGGARFEIAGLSEMNSHLGWAGGAGVEVGITPGWSTKAEYLYVELDNKTYVLSGASTGIDTHLLRLGVNYRF